MRPSSYKLALTKAALTLTILLLAAGASFAQSTVALTATPQTTTLPDGNVVPMWGWNCGAVTGTGTSCTALNGSVQVGGTTWQPPLIVVPSGSGLTITLTDSLPATVAATSLTIVGQIGTGSSSSGVGNPVRESAPRADGAHAGQTSSTWPIQGGGTFMPPAQGLRARSFAQEAVPSTPAVYTWTNLKQGTYLIETGTYPSIQGPMGLYGVLVVTTPTGAAAAGSFPPGTAYTGKTAVGNYSIKYDADVPLLLGEIDPLQNAAVAAAVANPALSETKVWNKLCGFAGDNSCYPAAVNFTPLYYTVNGVSFDSTLSVTPAAIIPATATTGNVMLRFVNAGLKMHVPSVAGLSMSLIAEDANVLPDVALAASQPGFPLTVRVQSDVFLSAGKVYDVMVNPPSTTKGKYDAHTFQVFDRELSLSSGGTRHDSGMQATLLVAGATAANNAGNVVLNPDAYFVSPGVTLNVSDPGKGVMANDVFVTGVTIGTLPTHGTVVLNSNGTFTYTPDTTWTVASSFTDTFTYTATNAPAKPAATVSLNLTSAAGFAPFANQTTFSSNVSTTVKVSAPGVLANDTDPSGYWLTAAFPPTDPSFASPPVVNPNGSSTVTTTDGLTVNLMPDGSFTAVFNGCAPSCVGGTVTFPHVAVNSQNVSSFTNTVDTTKQVGAVSVNFLTPSNLHVTVQDAPCMMAAGTDATKLAACAIPDYKWIIEQDLTFQLDPTKQVNNGTIPPTLGTQFHGSYMPVIAAGCTGDQSCERGQTVYNPATGSHDAAVCEGTGVCVPASVAGTPQQPATTPDMVNLPAFDAAGRPASYYISILSGDAANAFNTGFAGAPTVPTTNCGTGTTATGQAVASVCGHTMGGAPIPNSQIAGGNVIVNLEPNPIQPATVTAYVFEDDWPLNGEPDAGGGVDTLATQEVPLEDFQIVLWDDAGYSGDATGQMTYDMFNMPLTNALNGTVDPATGLDACPISNSQSLVAGSTALVGVIITCPRFESDGMTPSPITGQVVVRNLMPGRFGIIAHPGAAREARGEEWLQTNTLDGTHFQDSFIRPGGPAYFQEFGPGGYHVFFGEANPAIINNRINTDICIGAVAPTCNNSISGQVTELHMARPTNEYLTDSNVGASGDPVNYAPLAFTTCYVSLGDPDGETFQFTKCDQNGNFTFSGIPDGDWAMVVFDQWLDLIVDGTSKSISVHGGQNLTGVDFPAFTWQTHIQLNTYLDTNRDGIRDNGEGGIIQVPSRIRMRNGKMVNTSPTDINGGAGFWETFPLFNWYVVESDTTRFKGTGVHVVYDAGGQIDNAGPYAGLLNSTETNSLPLDLHVPGTVYCAAGDAACLNSNLLSANPGANNGRTTGLSTGRIDPGSVLSEGLQGFLSQQAVIDWGKIPYDVGETGGIRGHVVYASTRPFDDPSQQFQNLWEPLIPGVTINLYQEGTDANGVQTLKLIDTTVTSSWDAWAHGFRTDANGNPTTTPNMNCPGQAANDPFLPFTLNGTTNYLDPTHTALPYNSRYKCYDGLRVFNQIQPAPYDGMYQFPTVACSACVLFNSPQPNGSTVQTAMLPAGKYVVEMIPPQGYELAKEEDKNILIGDNYVAPVTQQFGPISNVFIIPDQATMNNTNPAFGTGGGANNPTTDLGHALPSTFGPGGMLVQTAPCVGTARIVPDYMSISPESGEVAPFAGATRNLCNRKEVTLETEMQASTDFFLWTKTPAASHFTGFILDDMSSEFDPASPDFGEKFAVPNLPISFKDFNGVEISRHYSDQWGIYNGLTYSTWEVNPPNPTGYAPNMMVTCMNDPGPIRDTNPASPTFGKMITDPLYNPAYSNFCYENPFMPQDTTYMDTPVVPTSAFAEGYNPPDCAYPDATPSILSADGDGGQGGPYVKGAGSTLVITALGDQIVPNHAYSGPFASTAPFNQKFITRHYGFGNIRDGVGTVTIGGVNVPVNSSQWSDTQITVTIPTSLVSGNSALPVCASSYSQGLDGATTKAQAAANALARFGRCGQLVITASNGRQSIDAVTVTIGGNAPTYVTPGTTIQSALDAATPGDLIIVKPGTYTEMLLMWKPVRLQGVGAASVTVNANTQPAGLLLEPWRRQVDCLFGLTLNGGLNGSIPPNPPGNTTPLVYDPSGQFSCGADQQNMVDPLPLEAVVGWDATINGNLAELLQEPSLMGAYEGSGITVLARGLVDPASVAAGNTPIQMLTNSAIDCKTRAIDNSSNISNFLCAPSRVDGITFTNSSQGGGGVFLHGWNHYTEVSNNRIHGNGGTLAGGIVVGQPEANEATFTNGIADPYAFNQHVNIHNNAVTFNVSYGDELNSNTPAAAGGVTMCLGSDYYQFNYNWVCGNMSTGDGGGFAHYGYSIQGDIEHNSFLFNQSYNTTITSHGGGVILQGGPPDGAACENATVDMDCPPGLTDGAGDGIVFNANLVLGNTAESGSGGGLRLQNINGADVFNNQTDPTKWNHVKVTNNIIANNVAGWIGGGVSLYDAVRVDLINNTIVSNDDTASAGVLFDTLGAPNANQPPPGTGNGPNPGPCNPTATGTCPYVTTSNDEPAGVATERHSAILSAAFLPTGTPCEATRPNCDKFSNPVLANNVIWKNRAFHITTTPQNPIGGLQTVVTLVPQLNQVSGGVGVTGSCPSGAHYWDIGVYGDKGAGDHSSTYRMNPQFSILDDPGYATSSNGDKTPTGAVVVSQYCNGSRVPPEIAPTICASGASAPGCLGATGGSITVPPGVPDINPFYPNFTLSPAATTDEGNNFINMFYGPLSISNQTIGSGTSGYNVPLGNFRLFLTSPAMNGVPTTATNPNSTIGLAPPLDFFGQSRANDNDPNNQGIDIGAVEYVINRSFSVDPTALTFSSFFNVRTAAQLVTVVNTGDIAQTFTFNLSNANTSATEFAFSGCTAAVPAAGSCTLSVTYDPTVATPNPMTALLNVNNGNGTTVAISLTGTLLLPTYTVSPTSLTFPPQFTNQTSAPQSVTITNVSTNGAPLPIVAPTITQAAGTGYAVVNNCPASLPATAGSNTCTQTVRLTPPNPGNPLTGTLNVNVSAATNGLTTPVSLTGSATVPPLPTLGSINPNTGVRGTTVPVTLSGANFFAGSTVNVPNGSGITVNTVSVVNATTITANFVISASATLAADNITVTSLGGTTNSVPFTVQGATLTSIAPNTGARGAVVPVTLTGTNLTGATSVTVSGGNVTISNFTAVNSTTVTATFTIAVGATASARNVAVVTPIGTTNNVTFTVFTPPAPTLSTINPPTGPRGSAVAVTLTGNNLSGTSSIAVSGGNITVSNINVVSNTSVTATFTIASTAALTARTVTASNVGGASNGITFTVTAGPALTSITPNVGRQGTAVPVTLAGSNLTGTTTVTVSGTGVTAGPLTVTAGSITTTLTITAGAATGPRNVTVTNPIGTSNPVTFTVVPAAGPITQVQANAVVGTGVASLTANFASSNTAGNLIIVFVRSSGAGSATTVSDTVGNTYVQAVAQSQTTDGHQLRLFYAANSKAGANNVTATFTGGANAHPWLAVYEYSGLNLTNPLDRTTGNQGTGTTANSGTTATTTSANELVFAGFGLPSAYFGSQTAGAPFVITKNDLSPSPAANETTTVTSTGAFAGTLTAASSVAWSGLIATFKP